MRGELTAAAIAVALASAAPAAAQPEVCLQMLRAEGVSFSTASKPHVETAVAIEGGLLGGIEYRGYRDEDLVLDCSLALSLARAGRFLRAAGVARVTYSSAYQVRNIRGTRRRSRHSYGLAIDIHTFETTDSARLDVADDYEQGLGDNLDCIGAPLTRGGAVLRTLACQMARSELFRTILTPDFDAGHYNHFHVEALPWSERADW